MIEKHVEMVKITQMTVLKKKKKEKSISINTHSPKIPHGANGLKLNPTFSGCVYKQVSHGFRVIVGG